MDGELGRVEVEDGVAVDQLLAEGVVAADGIDLLAGVVRHGADLGKDLAAPQGQVAAGDVQRRHQQIGAGGRLGQVDDLADVALVHVRPDQQEARLGQAAAGLVHGHGGHVGPCVHRGDRHARAEVEVGSVGLVGQTEHPRVVGHLRDGLQIGADAVVGGVVHQDGDGVRMLADGPLHLLAPHAQGDAEPVVHLGVDVDRHRAAEDQGVDDRAVDVAGQDDLIAALAGGKHHRLHGRGRAADHQKGVGRAEGVGSQVLGVPDHGDRVAEVVQRLHGVDVDRDAFFSEEGGHLRIAPAALVPGDVKGDDAHVAEPFQSLVDGRSGLVEIVVRVDQGLHLHSFPDRKTKITGAQPVMRVNTPFPSGERRSLRRRFQSLYSNEYFYCSY